MASARGSASAAAALIFASAVSSFVYSLAMPLIGEFPGIFGVSASSATWIVVVNALAGAVFTPILGRVGDNWGSRRTLLVAMSSLVVGSLICAGATSLAMMLVGRVLQGVAVGTVPLAIGIARVIVAEQRVSAVVGTLSATLGLGSGVGITLAGIVLFHASWRWVFVATALIAGAALLAILRLVPPDLPSPRAPFDPVGAVGLAALLTLVLVPLSKATEWGWTSPLVLTMLSAAAVIGGGWFAHQSQRRNPLVNVRLAVRGQFGASLVLSAVVGGALFFSLVTVVVVVQAPPSTGYGLAGTAMVAGLCLIPGNLMMLAAPLPTAAALRGVGVRSTLRLGFGFIAVGYLVRLLLDQTLWQVVVGYLVVQTGVAICLAAMPIAVVRSSPRSETAAAQGLSTTMRQAGIAGAGAGYAALVAAMHVSSHGHLYPTSSALDAAFALGMAISLVGAVATLLPLGRAR